MRIEFPHVGRDRAIAELDRNELLPQQIDVILTLGHHIATVLVRIRHGRRNALLDLVQPPTAIFAANDDMVAAVIQGVGERGIAVPRDLSVCGFDDTPIARHINPALTTVRQPTSEMGRLATLELFDRIDSPGGGRMVHVEHTLLFRESTRPPKKR
jgi:DNA-binding LacI/PurR family transcriptional regulator